MVFVGWDWCDVNACQKKSIGDGPCLLIWQTGHVYKSEREMCNELCHGRDEEECLLGWGAGMVSRCDEEKNDDCSDCSTQSCWRRRRDTTGSRIGGR